MCDKQASERGGEGPEISPERVYETRRELFLNDNNRIWSTGALLVPLSLAPFLALTQFDGRPEDEHFVLLGVASVFLMAFWLLISERHRRYQIRSYDEMRAMEGDRPRVPLGGWAPSVHFVRLAMLFGVVGLWAVAYLLWPD